MENLYGDETQLVYANNVSITVQNECLHTVLLLVLVPADYRIV